MSTEPIGLEIWSHRFEILIDLIRCDEYSSFDTLSLSYHFEDIHCSHHIRLESPYWITIALSHEWLCCEMEYYFWLIFITYSLEILQVVDICVYLSDVSLKIEYMKKIWLRIRRKSVADHTSSERVEPESKPCSLESSGTGNEDCLSGIEMVHSYIL